MILDLRPTEAAALADYLRDALDPSDPDSVSQWVTDVLDKLTSSNYDTPTNTAALLLDNERAQWETAHAATLLACNAITQAEPLTIMLASDRDKRATFAEECQGIVSRLADTLRAIVEAHPDIWQALEGRLAATFVTQYVRDGIDAADWLRLARDWINEQRTQDGAEPIR